ncbi:hypothetical protein [Cellulomonas sp. P5_C5]
MTLLAVSRRIMGSLRDRLDRAVGHLRAVRFFYFGRTSAGTTIEEGVVVSLTSFPARVGRVWLTVCSLLDQTERPQKVVLVLSRPEFPTDDLPRRLQRLQSRGLEIRFVEGNARSYKKLVPVLDAYPDEVIVTADDDVLYPRWWLDRLVSAHRSTPEMIVGHRGTEILLDGDRAAAPYVDWPRAALATEPHRVFLTGVGGILYPVGSLSSVVTDQELATELCPTADDIWFKAMGLLHGTGSRCITLGARDFPSDRSAQRVSLRSVNVESGANDTQFSAVMDHFDLWERLR